MLTIEEQAALGDPFCKQFLEWKSKRGTKQLKDVSGYEYKYIKPLTKAEIQEIKNRIAPSNEAGGCSLPPVFETKADPGLLIAADGDLSAGVKQDDAVAPAPPDEFDAYLIECERKRGKE